MRECVFANSINMNKSPMAVVALMVVVMAALTTAQTPSGGSGGGIPSCATKLAPCFNYLNATTTPPTTCCDPIKETITKERACLCGIYNNPALIQAFNINVTQALNLITLCHVDSVKDPSTVCKAEAPSPSATSASSGSTPTSPGTSTTSTSPANGAATITGAGLTGFVAFALAFGGYAMLN